MAKDEFGIYTDINHARRHENIENMVKVAEGNIKRLDRDISQAGGDGGDKAIIQWDASFYSGIKAVLSKELTLDFLATPEGAYILGIIRAAQYSGSPNLSTLDLTYRPTILIQRIVELARTTQAAIVDQQGERDESTITDSEEVLPSEQ